MAGMARRCSTQLDEYWRSFRILAWRCFIIFVDLCFPKPTACMYFLYCIRYSNIAVEITKKLGPSNIANVITESLLSFSQFDAFM